MASTGTVISSFRAMPPLPLATDNDLAGVEYEYPVAVEYSVETMGYDEHRAVREHFADRLLDQRVHLRVY